MDLSELRLFSFIVKIWVEDKEDKPGEAIWRGSITHVPSGERHYIKDLGEIRAFIAPYLEKMGVRVQKLWRVQHWLEQLKR